MDLSDPAWTSTGIATWTLAFRCKSFVRVYLSTPSTVARVNIAYGTKRVPEYFGNSTRRTMAGMQSCEYSVYLRYEKNVNPLRIYGSKVDGLPVFAC